MSNSIESDSQKSQNGFQQLSSASSMATQLSPFHSGDDLNLIISMHFSENNNSNENTLQQLGGELNTPELKAYQALEDQNLNYYHDYSRLFITNIVLTIQRDKLVKQKGELSQFLQKLEQRSEELACSAVGDYQSKSRRFRRNAAEIQRHFRCKVQNCLRVYGSDGSLFQHMKIKHPNVIPKNVSNFSQYIAKCNENLQSTM